MNYAIKELRNYGSIYKKGESLKKVSVECFSAAEALEKKEFIYVSDGVINDLLSSLQSVVNGLSTWGDNFLKEKQRQFKKADELKEAINFFRPNYK